MRTLLFSIFLVTIVAVGVLIFQYGFGEQKEIAENTDQSTGFDGSLRFGFDLRGSPQEDTRQYLPFLKYLEEATGYRFDIRFTPEDGKLDEDLSNGVVDIAAIGAVSYLNASSLGNVIPLVRGLNKNNKAEYQSVIIVSVTSQINSINDLKGKTLSFGSIDSTQGHIIPRLSLNQEGISLDDLGSYSYTGSHQNCADSVIIGKAHACALQDTLGKALETEGAVKIIYESKFYPSSGLALNSKLPANVIRKIRQALLDFDPTGKHSAGLYNWALTEMPNGFTEAREEDYNDLRNNMRELGFLK